MKIKHFLSRQKVSGYNFVFPAMIMLFAILVYPAVHTLVSSFAVKLRGGATVFSVENYLQLFEKRYYNTRNTAPSALPCRILKRKKTGN